MTHMHLHLAAPAGQRFYNGPKFRCPWCNDDRMPRLIKAIRRFLQEHPGVLKTFYLREAMEMRNWELTDFNRAMAELNDVEVCESCGCVITMLNPHEDSCHHSATRPDC